MASPQGRAAKICHLEATCSRKYADLLAGQGGRCNDGNRRSFLERAILDRYSISNACGVAFVALNNSQNGSDFNDLSCV